MTPPPSAIAAIDIGTNSVHMIVARGLPPAFEVITREKVAVRLGEGGGDMKRLGDAAMERGIRTLSHMKRVADAHDATVCAVATSAVREADNGEEFVRRAAEEAGIEIRVISGVEEARLIHLGASQALPLADKRSLLIDIGGGSTEVVLADHVEELFTRSFKLGAVRLTNRFFAGGSHRRSDIEQCTAFVRSTVAPARKDVRALGHDMAVVSSGTAETLAHMAAAARSGPDPLSLNGFTFDRDELARVTAALIDAPDAASRATLPGMDPGRADIILAGALILGALADAFRIREFTFSEYALREGVLLDAARRLYPEIESITRNAALDSAMKLCRRCDEDPGHAVAVAHLACRLFDELAGGDSQGSRDRLYLEMAALTANVGLAVSHAKHHLHSYYMVRNADLLGMADHEIEIVAQVARYHRKSPPKPSHEPFAALDETDKHRVRLLAGILRVAIGLDRSHDGRVVDVGVESGRDQVVITAIGAPDADLELNVYAANERSQLLSESLGRDIVVAARA